MHLTATLHTIAWLFGMSGLVFSGLRLCRWRVRLVWAGLGLLPRLHAIREAPEHDKLRRALAERPELLGVLVWPYIDWRWNAAARIDATMQHFQALTGPRRLLDFPGAESIEVARVRGADGEPGDLRLVLDKPGWFMREGQVVLNLFCDERRIYSVAFAMACHAGERVCYVGAIQGVAGERVLDLYRQVTKQLHGMRPRDLLIETLRVCCAEMGIRHILLVADAYRHHRAVDYFGPEHARDMTDYDPIWLDRGAAPRPDGFFALPTRRTARDLSSVPSKKRAMYRRRAELIDELFRHVAARVAGAAPAHG